MMSRSVWNLIILLHLSAAAASVAVAAERIRPYKANRFYWEYDGKPVLLLGGSDEDNLFNNPKMMMENLETLNRLGGNYIRGTLSCRDEGNVWPFEKAGGKYDLNRWNTEFWERLRRCCEESLKRDIIVQFEVWATFDFYRDLWLKNPWNPANNSNYTTENTQLKTEWNHHPAARYQPFFDSPPERNNDRLLLKYQEAFVRKVLDVTLPYPNVLYCLDNETATPPQWAWYWGAFIREETKNRKTTVELTEMWDNWDITSEHHRYTHEHPEFFSFTDVSQNNWQTGQRHYDRLIQFRKNLLGQKAGARPMNNVKVYGRVGGSNQPCEPRVNVDRWWQNVFAGCAGTRFHRPPSGLGLDDLAQKHIRAARNFASSFNIFRSEPRPDLLSEREDNEAYCLVSQASSPASSTPAARVYALYFPAGGAVVLDIGDSRKVSIRWFDINSAEFRGEESTAEGPRVRLKSPNTEQTWLAIVK